MGRALSFTVVAFFMFSVAAASARGIPDPNLSYVELDNDGYGLATCPAGDGPPFEYISVYAFRSDATPIVGIPASSFFWTVTGCDITITAVDTQTNGMGMIRFLAVGDETCPCDGITQAPSEIGLRAQIYTVTLNDYDVLYANTFDHDQDNDVDPVDFVIFSSHFGPANHNICSDYDCDGDVDPVDFVSFSLHFGH